MATKSKSTPPAKTVPSTALISRADLRAGIAPVTGKLTGDAFDSLDGEIYAGKNVLKLNVDEAGGPFILHKKVEKGYTPKPTKKNKNPEPIDTFEGFALGSKRPVHLPLSVSFVDKANDANLAQGDIFAVRRAADYAANGQSNCKSYELKVLARAGKPAEDFAKAYLAQNPA